MAHLGWLLGLVALSCWSILEVTSYYQVMDCCLRTSPQRIPCYIVRDYREQHIQEGCPIRALVFVTVRGRKLCAPPHALWVRHLKDCLHHRSKRRHHTSSQVA